MDKQTALPKKRRAIAIFRSVGERAKLCYKRGRIAAIWKRTEFLVEASTWYSCRFARKRAAYREWSRLAT